MYDLVLHRIFHCCHERGHKTNNPTIIYLSQEATKCWLELVENYRHIFALNIIMVSKFWWYIWTFIYYCTCTFLSISICIIGTVFCWWQTNFTESSLSWIRSPRWLRDIFLSDIWKYDFIAVTTFFKRAAGLIGRSVNLWMLHCNVNTEAHVFIQYSMILHNST